MPNCEGYAWYALFVKTNCERLVARGLEHLEVQGFLPTYKVRSGRKRNPKTKEKPLFPGYLFCHINLEHGPKLYNLPGIIRIVGNSKLPLPVRDSAIESIRRIISSDIPVAPCPYLAQGDEVIVVHGPLRGLTGVYQAAENTGHLIASFPLLQRSVSVRVEPHWIEPIHARRREFPKAS